MTTLLPRVTDSVFAFLADTGRMWRLAASAAGTFFDTLLHRESLRVRAVALQVIRAGHQSLPLVALISVFVGMILALQSAYQLRTLGAESLIAGLVGVSVTRELAPLLTAILVAGRVGSAITAEIGTMKVSQEIDALTVMGIDPVDFLVLPRLLGLLIALPALTVFADLAGIVGGCSVAVFVFGFGANTYFADTFVSLELQDVWGGVLKSFAFAGIIGLVGCQQGMATEGGAEEVGSATTSSVVRSIVLIIAADLFVTALLYVSG